MTAVDDRLCWVVVVVVVMLVLGSGAGETGGAALHGHPAARLLSISRPVPQFRRPDRGLLTDKMMQQTAQVGQRESFRGGADNHGGPGYTRVRVYAAESCSSAVDEGLSLYPSIPQTLPRCFSCREVMRRAPRTPESASWSAG